VVTVLGLNEAEGGCSQMYTSCTRSNDLGVVWSWCYLVERKCLVKEKCEEKWMKLDL
jgi:hypothetical protein